MLRIRQPIIKTDVVQTTVQDTAGYVALYRNFNTAVQRQQPQSTAQINKGNPISRGLVGAFIPGIPVNIVDNKPVQQTLSGSYTETIISHRGSRGRVISSGAYSYLNTDTDARRIFDLSQGTVFAIVVQDSKQNETYGFQRRNSSGEAAWGVGLFGGSANGPEMRFGSFRYFPSGNFNGDSNYSLSPHAICITADGTTARGYADGIEFTSGAYTPPTYDSFYDQRRVFFGPFIGSANTSIRSFVGLFWNRALSAEEVRTISENPWQIFSNTQPHYAVAPAIDEPKKLWGAVRKNSVPISPLNLGQAPSINSQNPLTRDLAVLGLGGRPQPQNFTWINAYTKQTPIITAEGNPAAHPNNIRTFDPKYGYGQKVSDSVSWGNTGVNTVSLAQLVDNANTAGLSMMWIGRIDTSGQGTVETAIVSYANGGQYGADRFSLYTNTGGIKNKLSARIRASSGIFLNTPTVDLPLDRAVCVMVTHHKVQGQKLYIDGKLVAQQNTTVNVDVQSTNANQFGCNTVNNNRNYIAAAWNRALTDTEIQQLYENPHQLYQQPHQTWYTTGILDTTPLENIGIHYNKVRTQQNKTYNSDTLRIDYANPLNDAVRALVVLGYQQKYNALWLFDNNTFQIRAAGNPNTWVNMTTSHDPVYGRGVIGFTGYENVNLNRSFTNTRGATVVMIIKPTGSTAADLFYWGTIFQSGWGGGLRGYIHADGVVNRLRLTSWNNNTTPATKSIDADLPANQTSVVIFTYSKVNGHKIYVNGQVAASDSLTGFGDLTFIDKRVGIGNRSVELYFSGLWDKEWKEYEVQQFSSNPYQVFNQTQKQYYYYTKPDPVSGNVAKLPRPIAQYKSQPLNITTVDRSNSFGRNTQFLWTAAAPRYDATGNYRATNSSDRTLLQSANLFGEPPNITATSEGLQYTSTATPVGAGTGGALVFRGNNTSSATGEWVPAPAGTGTGITVVVLGRYTSTASNPRLLGWTNQQNSGVHDTFQIVGGNPRIQYPNSYTKTPNYAGTTTSPYTLGRVHLTAYVSTLTQQYIYVDGNMVFQTSDVHYGGARGPTARLAIVSGGMAPIMIAVINKGLTQEEVVQLGQNPWQLYKQTQQHLFYSPKPEPQPYVLRIPHTKQLAQPQAQATSNIDWGNPLSRGLLGSFTPLAQYNASNQPATVQGTTITTQYSPSGAIWRNTQLAAATNYIRVPRGNFNYTTAVTFEALFKLNSAPYQASPTRVPGIMSQWQYVGGADARGPRLAMIHQFGNLGRLQFSVPVGASTTRIITQATPYLEPGKTYHIVATFAPSSPTAATLFLYINGQLNVSGNPFTGTFVNDVNNFISLMSDYVDNNAANPSADIDLYLARVYNVAKTATEVRELYRNPWQLYQTPKATFAISQQIKPLELATITSRRPYRQQPQAALSVDTGQTSFAKLLFCLVPQNNRLRDIGPARTVNTVAASVQTNVVTGHDAYGHFVHNPYGTEINVGNIFPTFNNFALLNKTYTVLISFLVESNVSGEQIISTMRPASGAGFQLSTKQLFDGFRSDSFRANCNGLNAEMYSAYVDGIPFESRNGTQSIYTTFTRQYNKLHTVAATFKTSNVSMMMEHYLGNMASAGGGSVASRYYLYTWWEGRLPDAMLKSLSENPWQIFEQNKKYSYFAGEYPSAEAPPEPPLVLNSRFLLFFG